MIEGVIAVDDKRSLVLPLNRQRMRGECLVFCFATNNATDDFVHARGRGVREEDAATSENSNPQRALYSKRSREKSRVMVRWWWLLVVARCLHTHERHHGAGARW